MPGRPSRKSSALERPPQAGRGTALVAADPSASALRAVAAHLALCTLDGEGRILAVNERFCALAAADRDRLLGWGLDVLRMEHAGRPLLEAASPALARGEAWQGEVRLVDVEDRERWAEGSLVELAADPHGGRQLLLALTETTARRRAEAALARLEGRMRQLVAGSPLVLYATSWGEAFRRLSYVSEGVRTVLGHRREAALAPGFWERHVHPADRASVLARLPVLHREGHLEVEYRLRAADGGWRWVRDHLRLVRDPAGRPTEIAGAMVDVTERRRAEDALRESERNLRTLAEHVGDALLVVQDGVLVYANRAAHELLGWEPGTLAGAALGEIASRRGRRALEALVGRWLAGEPAPTRSDGRLRRRDGTTVEAEMTASRILWDGEPAVVVAARDVGVQRAAERELRRARDEARAAERAKAALLANTSHEIRTPLAGVIGMLELVEGEALPPRARRRVANARNAARHLMRLLDELLELSRLEAGAFPVRPEPVRLAALVEEVAQGFADAAAAKRLTLDWRVDPALRAPVRTDPVRLRQVLSNLVGNAVKFTEHGGIEIEALPDGEGRMRVEVRDTGCGIGAADLERVFRPFAQADESAARRHGGTGLGLAIARQIAERLGGTLEATSTPGRGSRFTLHLPREAAGVAEAAPGPLAGLRVGVACGGFVGAALEAALRLLGAEPAAPDAGGLDAVVGEPGALPPPGRGCRRVAVCVPWEPGARDGADAGVHRPLVLDELARAVAGREDAPEARGGAPRRAPAGGDAGRVLVVEDDPVNREVAVGLLERIGCEVVAEPAAEPALARLRRRERFDLVLMDCQLPGMDGYEAVRALRAWEATAGAPRTRVVAMTAHAMPGDRERCLAVGMDGYLCKPVAPGELEALVAEVRGDADTHPPAGAPPA
ncbi:MAG TPA: PAS domain S-box protein, partial [Chromatiales bacterium]|nr:PAS domain S-box protein [Chromatiales bacterium]